MFYLHVSNRTENLMRQLAEILRIDRQPSPFAAELFLIQSRGMERMICQFLADQLGCFANFAFYRPQELLEFVAKRLDLTIAGSAYDRQTLSWRIEGLLRQVLREQYQQLTAYLSGPKIGLKRYQLARRLANIFDQYQLMRPQMLSGWERGRLATDNPAELWQMALWQQLLAQENGGQHRGVLFTEIQARLAAEKDSGCELPKRISIVGIHSLPPSYLRFLNSLAKAMDVHFFLLSPVREYWGDLLATRKAASLAMGQQEIPPDDASLFHPLLTSLGGQGRDLQNLFLEEVELANEFASFDPLPEKELYTEKSLLAKIQADLLAGRVVPALEKNCRLDHSVTLVACHSKQRELQIVKDYILNLLHQDKGLELRDIIVMAPDIQDYAPYIPAVFAEIGHSIADSNQQQSNSYIAAFSSFLDLFRGRYSFSEVFDLLANPCIFPAFALAEADLEPLRHWADQAGIRWGLSADQRAEDGLFEFSEASWRYGLDRLLMGFATGNEEMVGEILPLCGPEGQAAYCLGGLYSFIELIDQAREDFAKSSSLRQWHELLSHYLERLFGEEAEADLHELRTLLAGLGRIEPYHHHDPLAFDVIYHWFANAIAECRSSSGFLRGQLTFCSMLPMRSVPFHSVCLLGLNEGSFPRSESFATFDLMAGNHQPGDRSLRSDDRYQFLEAICAARSNLYLSYLGRSIKTNEELPPSVVLAEFIDLLQNVYGIADAVTSHPLHPFSPRYFAKDREQKLYSFDQHMCAVSKSLYGEKERQKQGCWWQGSLDATPGDISFTELQAFLSHPQRFFVRNRLGLRADMLMAVVEETESFALTGLDRYLAEQLVVEYLVDEGPKSEELLLKRLQASARFPLKAQGQLLFQELLDRAKAILIRVDGLGLGSFVGQQGFSLSLGQTKITGSLTNLLQNGSLILRFGKLRGKDLVQGWLTHLIHHRLEPGLATYLVSDDALLTFKGEAGPDLEMLVELFLAGCITPSPLYTEQAFAYAAHIRKKRVRKDPLDVAVDNLYRRMEKGYEPEIELLYGRDAAAQLKTPEFIHLAKDLMAAILEAAHD